jgi:hypothetical protein
MFRIKLPLLDALGIKWLLKYTGTLFYSNDFAIGFAKLNRYCLCKAAALLMLLVSYFALLTPTCMPDIATLSHIAVAHESCCTGKAIQMNDFFF